MKKFSQGTFGTVAAVSVAAAVSASIVVLSGAVLGERLIAMQTANAGEVSTTGPVVNRESKAAALPIPPNLRERAEIKTVEVIGLRDASIVYRDRSGNVLFQTDPLANVTIVTKNVELPEVTIREAESTTVERIPVEETVRKDPLQGCESAFAKPSPETLTRTPSRCVTELPGATTFAGLN